MVSLKWNLQIPVNIPLTNVPGCVKSQSNDMDCGTCSFQIL